jgi:hypothetical protein
VALKFKFNYTCEKKKKEKEMKKQLKVSFLSHLIATAVSEKTENFSKSLNKIFFLYDEKKK